MANSDKRRYDQFHTSDDHGEVMNGPDVVAPIDQRAVSDQRLNALGFIVCAFIPAIHPIATTKP